MFVCSFVCRYSVLFAAAVRNVCLQMFSFVGSGCSQCLFADNHNFVRSGCSQCVFADVQFCSQLQLFSVLSVAIVIFHTV